MLYYSHNTDFFSKKSSLDSKKLIMKFVRLGLLNRVYFETHSFQKCQYFEPETPNSWLLAPDFLVSKLQFSLHGRGLCEFYVNFSFN